MTATTEAPSPEHSHSDSPKAPNRYKSFGAFFANSSETIKKSTDERVRLEAIAERDSDTGLYTKAMFMEKVQELARKEAGPENTGASKFLLVFVDMNDFGIINKGFGHTFGDRAIKEAADVLKGAFNRAGDIVARFGGDEFMIFSTRYADKEEGEHEQDLSNYLNRKLKERLDEEEQALAFMSGTSFAVGTVEASFSELIDDPEDGLNRVITIADDRMRANKSEMKSE